VDPSTLSEYDLETLRLATKYAAIFRVFDSLLAFTTTTLRDGIKRYNEREEISKPLKIRKTTITEILRRFSTEEINVLNKTEVDSSMRHIAKVYWVANNPRADEIARHTIADLEAYKKKPKVEEKQEEVVITEEVELTPQQKKRQRLIEHGKRQQY
jgi:hypothetical protein